MYNYENDDITSMLNNSNMSIAQQENMLVENIYMVQLMTYALSRYKWLNLPDSFDERFMEICLNYKGSFVAYKDKYDKLVVSDYTTNGKLNRYYYPTSIYAYNVAGKNVKLDSNEYVLCFNNYLMFPTVTPMRRFSRIIGDISRTLEVIINAEKVPFVFYGKRKIMLTFKKLFNRVKRNEPAIFLDSNIVDPDSIKTLDLKHQFNGVSIFELKRSYLNEALTFIGVDNSSISKRERVNSVESELSNGINEVSREAGLRSRKEFCKKFNEMFGTNIDCIYYSDYNKDKVIEDDEPANDI